MFVLRRNEAQKARVFESLDELRQEAGDRLAELAKLQFNGDFSVKNGQVSLEGYGVYFKADDIISDFSLPFPEYKIEATDHGLQDFIRYYGRKDTSPYQARLQHASGYVAQQRRYVKRFSDWENQVKRWVKEMKRIDQALAVFNRDQILLVEFFHNPPSVSREPIGSIH